MRTSIAMIVVAAVTASGCATSARRATPSASDGNVITTPTTGALATADATSAGPGVVHDDFDALWTACEDAARDRLFPIERTDYRAGVLTTRPVVSKQFFEFWRNDAVTVGDIAESSLATIRRTIRFDIAPTDGGKFRATPSVLVERYSAAERRITSAVFYRSLFRRQALRASGTRESDRGLYLPGRYWYELGNDEPLEKALRESVRAKLKRR